MHSLANCSNFPTNFIRKWSIFPYEILTIASDSGKKNFFINEVSKLHFVTFEKRPVANTNKLRKKRHSLTYCSCLLDIISFHFSITSFILSLKLFLSIPLPLSVRFYLDIWVLYVVSQLMDFSIWNHFEKWSNGARTRYWSVLPSKDLCLQ